MDTFEMSGEVMRHAECTTRQLDYWCRLGLFGPQHRNVGTGRPRVWTRREADGVRIVTMLRSRGASLKVMRAVYFAYLGGMDGIIVISRDGSEVRRMSEGPLDGWVVDLDYREAA